MLYVPVVCGAIFLVIFLITCKDKRSVKGVFTKNTTSLFFILTAAAAIIKSEPTVGNRGYGILVLIGLVCGMLGDIYLDQKWVYPNDMKQYLNAGFMYFGFGHLFYIGAIAKAGEFGIKHLLIAAAVGVVVAVGNLILEKPMKQDFGEFKAIVTAYSFILASMVGASVIAAIKTGYTGFILYAVGAVLFLLSDLILSPMYFAKGKNTPVNFILNHLTYYVGQYLIALSIAFMPTLNIV